MPLSSQLKTSAVSLATERLNSYWITLLPRFYKTLGRAAGNFVCLYLRKHLNMFSFSTDHLRLS